LIKHLCDNYNVTIDSNQISDYSFLSILKNLTKLDLSSNQISDIPFLGELVNVETNIEVNIKVDLPKIKSDFEDLKIILDKANPEIKKEMDNIQDSFDEVSPNSKEADLNKPFNKLGRFLKKLNDENSDVNKIIKGTQKGIELTQKVGRIYNKFAQWLALPVVPDLLLGKD